MAQTTVSNIYAVGPSYYLSASTASTSANVVSTGASITQIYVENLDTTNDVFVNWSLTGAVTAVAPTVGNPQTGVCIQNGQGRVIQLSALNQYNAFANVAVVTFGSTANVVITPVA